MLIWSKNPLPENSAWNYHFTKFALGLNFLPETLKGVIPRTDSRLRPDQKALENGQFDLAASEKFRLEEKQRAARKKLTTEYVPKFFVEEQEKSSGETIYKLAVDYWAIRNSGNWEKIDVPDLF